MNKVPENITAAQLREQLDRLEMEAREWGDNSPDPMANPFAAADWFSGADLGDNPEDDDEALGRLKAHREQWGEEHHDAVVHTAMHALHVFALVRHMLGTLNEND